MWTTTTTTTTLVVVVIVLVHGATHARHVPQQQLQ
jgi:hypothetical protein